MTGLSDLRKFAKQHKIEKEIVNRFWKCFENYQNSKKEEFLEFFPNYKKNLINVGLYRLALQINEWPDIGNENIIAYSPITFNGNEVGMYKLIYDLSGEIIDDVFVIY
ncbi:hypothetical protein [Tepidibacter thalassicus]|uniref:Uncharacterized protein n=1 Tax=Tepidibacter thalassicus DSM 15285 TaxID=1123350 RepID=A0A1M5SEK9_9FIRM|nr:hypothetical protein [Tepidibacter thalassicus]SHH36909.1 hypothetical protein SAMN02744040_01738 [Tepidibacter thalassicus DSM 15285]